MSQHTQDIADSTVTDAIHMATDRQLFEALGARRTLKTYPMADGRTRVSFYVRLMPVKRKVSRRRPRRSMDDVLARVGL